VPSSVAWHWQRRGGRGKDTAFPPRPAGIALDRRRRAHRAPGRVACLATFDRSGSCSCPVAGSRSRLSARSRTPSFTRAAGAHGTGARLPPGRCRAIALLERRGVPAQVLPTEAAVRLYNQLAAAHKVGGVFRSTCRSASLCPRALTPAPAPLYASPTSEGRREVTMEARLTRGASALRGGCGASERREDPS
jgi:hypothetical protein